MTERNAGIVLTKLFHGANGIWINDNTKAQVKTGFVRRILAK